MSVCFCQKETFVHWASPNNSNIKVSLAKPLWLISVKKCWVFFCFLHGSYTIMFRQYLFTLRLLLDYATIKICGALLRSLCFGRMFSMEKWSYILFTVNVERLTTISRSEKQHKTMFVLSLLATFTESTANHIFEDKHDVTATMEAWLSILKFSCCYYSFSTNV